MPEANSLNYNTMEKKCQQCNREFESNRTGTKKFCSDSCKVAFNRNRLEVSSVTELAEMSSVTPSVTENTPTVTPPSRYPKLDENKAQSDAITHMYDSFTSKDLVAEGVRPPEWKRKFATKGEAIENAKEMLREMGLEQNPQGYWVTEEDNVSVLKIDYSKWK